MSSRTAEIEAARALKAQSIPPAQPVKGGLIAAATPVMKLFGIGANNTGFRVLVGGVVSGAGFAPLGVEYRRPDLAGGQLFFRGRAQASVRKFQKYDLQFGAPSLKGERLYMMAYAVRQDYPSMHYYGSGPDSRRTFHSNYRLENTAFQGTAGVRPLPFFNVGGSLGYLFVNVGPGTNETYVSSERVFSPLESPGIDQQANFLSQAGFLQVDYRDSTEGPRSGGNYRAEYGRYIDKTLGRHDFQRLDLHLQQYFSFFNKQRVIALHGKSVLTFTDEDQTLPFYMQPSLGGSEDLRGFRSFRFADNNMIATTLEYQWRTYQFLDLALFWDTGKVFPRRQQWNFKDVESTVGVGFRFNVRGTPIMRADVAFSHEGFQVWVRLKNLFGERAAGPVIHNDLVDGRGMNAHQD